MDKLIESYDVELIAPPCSPGAFRWAVKAHLEIDISPVLPYLNAKLKGCQYDHTSQVLIWKPEGRAYAFRPHEISAASAEDRAEAHEIIAKVVDSVNQIWRERDQIAPSFTEKVLPKALDIFKLLPGINCGECNYPACMAYAVALRAGKAELAQCPLLLQQSWAKNRDKLLDLFPADSN